MSHFCILVLFTVSQVYDFRETNSNDARRRPLILRTILIVCFRYNDNIHTYWYANMYNFPYASKAVQEVAVVK